MGTFSIINIGKSNEEYTFSIIDTFTDLAELMHLVYQTTGITKGCITILHGNDAVSIIDSFTDVVELTH
jgi:hypothetical protein